MALALSDIRERVRRFFQDETGLVWSDHQLDEAIRLALAGYSQACGSEQTIQGLDGAIETTFPAADVSILTIGAAGYAACGRAARREEGFQPDVQSTAGLERWGERRLEQYAARLEAARSGKLRAADALPWPESGWRLDGCEEIEA